MKVLLILPPNTLYPGDVHFVAFPLGIGYLASVLEKDGHNVEAIDCIVEDQTLKRTRNNTYYVGLSWDIIKERINKFKPDVLGISCSYSVDFNNARKIAQITKEVGEIPVVIGGAHPSALPYEALKDENIDYVVIGEGEQRLSLLIKSIEERKPPKHIDGLGFKDKGKIIVNPMTKYIENLDELPFPARHLLPMEKYMYGTKIHGFFYKRQPHATMITSRGCPQNCMFCTIHKIWGKKWRARSAKNVVDEIGYLVKEYGIREIHFEDDNISLNRKRMEAICDEIIDRKIDITWETPNGISVNTLDEDLIRKMKKSGCYRIFLGIESGNQVFLNNVIGKNLSLEKVKSVNKLLKEAGITVSGFFVIGLPGETRQHIRETINFAKSLDLDGVAFSIATPFPGSELYNICKNKIDINDFSNFRLNNANIDTGFLSRKEIIKLRNLAYFEFQLNKFLKHPFDYLTKKQNYNTLLRYLKRIMSSKIKAFA